MGKKNNDQIHMFLFQRRVGPHGIGTYQDSRERRKCGCTRYKEHDDLLGLDSVHDRRSSDELTSHHTRDRNQSNDTMEQKND